MPDVAESAAARPPGPGLATGRQVPALRPERARRRPGRAGHLPLRRRRRRRPRRSPGRATSSPSYSPDGRYIAATRTSSFGNDVVILDASNGRELLRVTNDGASWAPVWSPAGDAIAFLHIDGQIVDLKLATARRRRPRTGRSRTTIDADRGVRPRRRLAPGLVHPGRRAAAADRRRRPPRRRRPRRRAAPRPEPAADGAPTSSGWRPGPRRPARVLCLGLDPDPAALPAGFSRGPRGRRAVRDAARRGGRRRTPRPSSRTSPSSRRSGRPGWPPSSGSGRRLPADLPVVADAKRGDIGSTAARQAVALFDGLGADAVTVNPYLGARGDRAAARARGPVRLRPVPDLEPGRRRAPGPRRRRPTRRPARRPSRSTCASPGASPAGARAARSGWSSARRPRPSCAAIRAIAPGLAFLVPGRRRPGRRGRAGPRGTDRRRRRRPAAGPGGGLLVNVSRGIAGGRRRTPATAVRATRASASRRPPPTGPTTPCATLAAALTGRAAPRDRARGRTTPTSQEHRRPCRHLGPLELVIILVIALLILGPGKLPEVGAALGKSIREFRKASSDVQDAHERRHVAAAGRRPGAAAAAAAAAAPAAAAAAAAPAAAAPVAEPRPRAAPRPRPRPPSRSRPRPPPRRPPAEPTPGSELAGRVRPRPMADADALRDAGVSPASPRRPEPAPPPGGRARRRDGHVARRPPRRAAHAPLPVDPRGRGRRRSIGFYFATPIRDLPAMPTARRRRRSRSSGSATRSSSSSRSRSSSGSSSRCRCCSTSSGRSSRPGLTPTERKTVRPWIPLALLFFALGVAIAYVVLPYAIAFLLSFTDDDARQARSPPGRTSTS